MADGAAPHMTDRPRLVPFTPGPDTAREFRNAMGRFPTGVTVVTVQGTDGPIGITANSFSSVSIDPPLLLWCPAKRSSRFEAFARAPRFAIHILGQGQMEVARGFAQRADAFEGLALDPCPHAVPLLADCLARFECKTVQTHDAGDHMIVVGEVLEAGYRDGEALVFSEGMFGRFVGH